jgi:GT2 family glycosyltransferase
MASPDVAVVILNWNGRSFLEKFLPGVVAHSAPHRIIVADNDSTDDSVAYLRAHFPSVELIINESNGGFAKGYNDALKQVSADLYVLLNSDVEVTLGWLDPLVATMEDPKLAGCQPKVLAYDRKEEFEYAGAAGGYIDKYYFPFCRGRIFNIVEKDRSQYDFPAQVFWATGACMMIRSEVYHKAGMLDERFFAHMEEIDLCWRAQKMGYRFECVTSSTVYHVGGGTLNYNSPRKTYLNFRNSLLMVHKNHSQLVYWLLFRRLSLDGLASLMFLFKGRFGHFWAVLKSHVAFYWNFPSSIRERKKVKLLGNSEPAGRYKGSILYEKHIRRVKTFDQLNQRRFSK